MGYIMYYLYYDGICSVLGYNEFVLAVYVVLIIYCVYFIVIYEGICVRDMVKILCELVFLTFMKT